MITSTRVEDVFLAALEKGTPEERAAYLRDACRDAPELFLRVERLLEAHPKAKGFLEHPAPPPEVTSELPIREGRGSVIGPYKLLEQIGEGGMGVVFMAEQTRPVQRRVALKIIKAGMDTREVVARFEAERQALAMMEHPNIARVLDAGATDTGRPYFVMELVRGVPMTEFCNQKNLSIRERLELFVTVCQAVQHAHQKGIIHRDIKPTNVLITLHDGRPMIKVIDFGVAKATGQKLTDKTLFTGFTQMIGTPLYMSPEQAEMTSQDIDTRSDLYSCGVLLYELLTGSTPFDSQRLKSASFDELRRIIREEEPPRPSTRLTTLALEAASTVGTQRRSDPRQLSRLFRGELDWIVMKCLEKDRTRRYETASALAGDVERYLHDESVQACPPSARYRFGKFARRNKATLLTAALVMLTLVGGIIGTTWGLLRASEALDREATQRRVAEKSRQRADEQANLALKTLKLVVNDIQLKLANVPGAQKVRRSLLVTAIDGLREVARNLNTATDADLATVHSHLDLAAMLLIAGDQNGGATEESREQYESAHKIALRLAEENPDNSRIQLALARSYHGLGAANQWRLGNSTAALNAYQNELKICRKLADNDPRNAVIQESLTSAYKGLGDVYLLSFGNIVAASDAYEQLLVIQQKLAGDHPRNANFQEGLVWAYFNRGDVRYRSNDARSARDEYGKGLEIAKKLAAVSPDDSDFQSLLADSYQRFGAANDDVGDLDAARDAFKKSLDIDQKLAQDDPHNLKAQQNLAAQQHHWGELNLKMGNAPVAQAAYQESLKIFQAAARSDPKNAQAPHDVAEAYSSLASLHFQLGDLSAARDACEKGLVISRKLARDYPKYVDAQRELVRGLRIHGDLDRYDGRTDEAIQLDEESLRISTAELGATEVDTIASMSNLAAAYVDVGRTDEAIRLNEETLKLRKTKLGPEHPDTLNSMSDLTEVYLRVNRLTEAESLARECLELRKTGLPNEWRTFDTRSLLGRVLLAQKRYAEAEPLLLSGYEGMHDRAAKIPAGNKSELTEALQFLVQLYEATNQPGKAATSKAKLAEFDKPATKAIPAAPKQDTPPTKKIEPATEPNPASSLTKKSDN